MARLHLFEVHEMPWCPGWLRDSTTGIIQFVSNVLPAYNSIIPNLIDALKTSDSDHIVDLCAGSGGPWRRIIHPLETQANLTKVILTDLYPNVQAFADLRKNEGDTFTPHSEPVDVRDVPPALDGFRTMFASFHHFERGDARAILQNAVDQRQGIGIFEITERRPLPMLFIALTSLIWAWVFIPFVRPFRLIYLPFNYLIPIIPLSLMFDGLVSCLRTYSVEEMQALVDSIDTPDDYTWHIGRNTGGGSPLPVLYLIGVPHNV